MAHVRKETLVNAVPEKVFDIAAGIERFPEAMPDLKSVEVLERDGNRCVSRWVSVADLGPIQREVSWTEEELWDREGLSCRFSLVKGDMKSYGGSWSFTPDGAGTRVVLEFDYEIGIPLLGALVHRIVQQKMEENCSSLLAALKQLAEN